MDDSENRYTFTCPSCAGSFSIHIERIPPVRARFSCPKCGKAMDFPSRDEARVYIQLQGAEAAAAAKAAPAPELTPPVAPVPAPTPPGAADRMEGSATEAVKRYRVEKRGFEHDEYDRRAMRILIRTLALNENDQVAVGSAAAIRADAIPELKSLFELRKTARATPPPVCRKHTDRLAHYQ